MSERGSVLSLVIQVAGVTWEFISSEECPEGTQHLKWEVIIFKNSSIQVFTRNTSLLHSLWYLPFSQLCTFCLIVWVADSFLRLSFFFSCISSSAHCEDSSCYFPAAWQSICTKMFNSILLFHSINGIQIFLVCLLVCLWVQYLVCAEAHSQKHSPSPLPAALRC